MVRGLDPTWRIDPNVGSILPDEQAIPAIGRMLPLLMRGVAVHHSGLLPVPQPIRH